MYTASKCDPYSILNGKLNYSSNELLDTAVQLKDKTLTRLSSRSDTLICQCKTAQDCGYENAVHKITIGTLHNRLVL